MSHISLESGAGLAWQADGTDEDDRDWLIPNLLSPCHSRQQRREGSKREREREAEVKAAFEHMTPTPLRAAGSQLMAMLGTQRERTVADFPKAVAPIPAHHQVQMSHQQLETFRLMLRFSESLGQMFLSLPKISHDSQWSQSPPFSQHSSLAVLTENPPLIIIGIQRHNTPP
ncbi:unnamed protein product [Pleuronectes platessa]|uniref:Uncharacterized protein n=1 Tax=Pleuronectes platessa TaxID=8262 RepID=A0A9N7Z623_PLEPL|nr:unnamed protein product [Pleuronectes platessa]